MEASQTEGGGSVPVMRCQEVTQRLRDGVPSVGIFGDKSPETPRPASRAGAARSRFTSWPRGGALTLPWKLERRPETQGGARMGVGVPLVLASRAESEGLLCARPCSGLRSRYTEKSCS